MLVWGCFLANVVIFLSLSVYLCGNMCFEGSFLMHLGPHSAPNGLHTRFTFFQRKVHFSFHTTHSANVCDILVHIFCHFVSKDPSIFMLCNIFLAKNAILCCKTYKIIWWYQKKTIPLQSFSTRCSKNDATKRCEILRS